MWYYITYIESAYMRYAFEDIMIMNMFYCVFSLPFVNSRKRFIGCDALWVVFLMYEGIAGRILS